MSSSRSDQIKTKTRSSLNAAVIELIIYEMKSYKACMSFKSFLWRLEKNHYLNNYTKYNLEWYTNWVSRQSTCWQFIKDFPLTNLSLTFFINKFQNCQIKMLYFCVEKVINKSSLLYSLELKNWLGTNNLKPELLQ